MRAVFVFQVDTSSAIIDRAASKFHAFPFIFTFAATQTYPLASRVMTGIMDQVCPENDGTWASVPHVMAVPLIVPRRTLRSVPLPTAPAMYTIFVPPPSSPPPCHPRVWMNARERFMSVMPGRSASKRDPSSADGAAPRGAHDQLPGPVPLNRIAVDDRMSPSFPRTSTR